MQLNYELLLLPCLLLALVLTSMAGRRGLSKAPWVLIAFIPIVNLLGLLFLATRPTSRTPR